MRSRLSPFAVLALCICTAAPAFAQQPGADGPYRETDRARFLRWAYQDLGALGQEITTPRFAVYTAGALGYTLGAAWADDDILLEVEGFKQDSKAATDILDTLDDFGGPAINYPVFGLAAVSLVTNNTKFQDAAMTSLQTLVYAGLTGYALKGIIGRARPEFGEDVGDPYAFFETTGKNPFSDEGNSSYPSGHAISSFGIITAWVVYYPSPLTYALYLIPTGTVINRLAVRKHWPTDIVVGAALGIGMGRFLARRHQRIQSGEDRASRHDIDLNVGLNTAALTYRF